MSVSEGPAFDPAGLVEALGEHGVSYIVVGGVAVQAHGYLRGTGDLDVIPRPGVANLARLAEALSDLDAKVLRSGRRPNLSDPHVLARADLLPLVTRHGRLDVIRVDFALGPGVSYDDLERGALVIEHGGRSILVAGIDDLVRMKHRAGRAQDLDDIAALTRPTSELAREAAEEAGAIDRQLEVRLRERHDEEPGKTPGPAR